MGRRNFTQEEWVEKASVVHNNKYDYSKVEYTCSKNKVKIICPVHGEFEQVANEHMRGKGCIKCFGRNVIKYDKDSFIEKSNIVHNNRYIYNNVEYINCKKKVIITCPIHGDFEQTPDHHLRGQGCPICKNSKGEQLIYKWLQDNNVSFKAQHEITVDEIARNSNLIIVDFFIEYNNEQYFIEYDGEQHFEYKRHFHKNIEGFRKQQHRDLILTDFCKNNNIRLIRFNYKQLDTEIINWLDKLYII